MRRGANTGWSFRRRPRSHSSWATSSATEHSDRIFQAQRRGSGRRQVRLPSPRRPGARQRPRPRLFSSKNAAIAVVDVPAVEAGNAEFDIVADRSKALAIFDQIPDGTCVAIRKRYAGGAVAALDGAVRSSRLIACETRVMEADDIHIRQVGHMGDLMPEAIGDG